ncbi:hypothetical protein HRbin41_00946 [bacterium HR41]|nr:hypothetical protein HRbin41_00946 [bacterium HR41]
MRISQRPLRSSDLLAPAGETTGTERQQSTCGRERRDAGEVGRPPRHPRLQRFGAESARRRCRAGESGEPATHGRGASETDENEEARLKVGGRSGERACGRRRERRCGRCRAGEGGRKERVGAGQQVGAESARQKADERRKPAARLLDVEGTGREAGGRPEGGGAAARLDQRLSDCGYSDVNERVDGTGEEGPDRRGGTCGHVHGVGVPRRHLESCTASSSVSSASEATVPTARPARASSLAAVQTSFSSSRNIASPSSVRCTGHLATICISRSCCSSLRWRGSLTVMSKRVGAPRCAGS